MRNAYGFKISWLRFLQCRTKDILYFTIWNLCAIDMVFIMILTYMNDELLPLIILLPVCCQKLQKGNPCTFYDTVHRLKCSSVITCDKVLVNQILDLLKSALGKPCRSASASCWQLCVVINLSDFWRWNWMHEMLVSPAQSDRLKRLVYSFSLLCWSFFAFNS